LQIADSSLTSDVIQALLACFVEYFCNTSPSSHGVLLPPVRSARRETVNLHDLVVLSEKIAAVLLHDVGLRRRLLFKPFYDALEGLRSQASLTLNGRYRAAGLGDHDLLCDLAGYVRGCHADFDATLSLPCLHAHAHAHSVPRCPQHVPLGVSDVQQSSHSCRALGGGVLCQEARVRA